MVNAENSSLRLEGLPVIREHLSLTQAQTAYLIGVGKQAISNSETGQNYCLSFRKTVKLAQALGCGVDDLLKPQPMIRLQEIAIAYKERELAALKAGTSEAVAS